MVPYEVLYIAGGQITHSFTSATAPSKVKMLSNSRDDDQFVMRHFSRSNEYRVFDLRKIVLPNPRRYMTAKQYAMTFPKPSYIHKDRDACLMFCAMQGDR